MKKSDLKVLINECIYEVLAEDNNIKKQEAINEIKRIIAENDLNEEDLEELNLAGIKSAVTGLAGKIKNKLGLLKDTFKTYISKISPIDAEKAQKELRNLSTDQGQTEIEKKIEANKDQLNKIVGTVGEGEGVKLDKEKVIKIAKIVLPTAAFGFILYLINGPYAADVKVLDSIAGEVRGKANGEAIARGIALAAGAISSLVATGAAVAGAINSKR